MDEISPRLKQQGYSLFSIRDLLGWRGQSGKQQLRAHPLEYNWTFIDPTTTLEIVRSNPIISGIIYNRANEISGLHWKVTTTRSVEDEVFEVIGFAKHLYDESLGAEFEFENHPEYVANVLRRRIAAYYILWQWLQPYGLKPDLSNYDRCLVWWRKSLARKLRYSTDQIRDWLERPGKQGNISDLMKEYTVDYIAQGRAAFRLPTDYYDGLELFPGGTLYPIKGRFLGEPEIFVQLMNGPFPGASPNYEPLFFQPGEVSMAYYMPNSALATGLKPIDSLVNIALEMSNHSARMRDNADGDIVPEKLIVVLQDSNSGGMTLARAAAGSGGPKAVGEGEITRLNEIANKKAKEEAIRFVRGMGGGFAEIDMSKSDTFSIHNSREETIHRKAIAIALGATDNEINNATDGVIAKAGAEANQATYNKRTIKPTCISWERQLTHDIFPRRFGPATTGNGRLPEIHYKFEFGASKTQAELVDDAIKAAGIPALTPNEIRTIFLNLDARPEEEFDRPIGAQSEGEQIAGAIGNLSLSGAGS